MNRKSEWTILDEAHELLRAAVRGVPAGDMGKPTPCADWTVAQVLQHAVGDQLAYAAAITGGPGPEENPFTPSGTLSSSPETLVDAAVRAAADAWATVGKDARDVAVPMPPNTMTAETGAGACALDAAVHAWDIAVATGQGSPLGTDLARALLPVARTVVIQPLRDYGAFGPVLADRPGDDDIATLLRFLGRAPEHPVASA